MTLLEEIENLTWHNAINKLKSILRRFTSNFISDAPINGNPYVRQDAEWVEASEGGTITATKSEIDTLISTNLLIKGATYKITDCNSSLFGGTTLFLLAIENNKLESFGTGIFYTPKYTTDSGYGIYTPYVECGVSNIVGIFDTNEVVTADTGAVGTLFGDVNGGFILPISGDWASAVTMQGDNSGATADITSVTVPLAYAIDDTTFWGGFVWRNLTGDLGSFVDFLNLDATNWVKVAYNETDYNVFYDFIKYDYNNDWISYREDLSGNKVDYGFNTHLFFIDGYGLNYSAIAVFQWGNNNDIYSGTFNNIVNNAYCENINFRGSRNYSNTYCQSSSNYSNTYGQGSSNYSNTYGQGSSNYSNTYGQDSINSSNIYPNNLINQKGVYENGTYINSVNFTSSTIIFESFSKTIFNLPNGTPKIRYYDNSGTLIISDITD